MLARADKEQLVLYGGYSHPFSYPFNQQVTFFDECHVFEARTGVWQLIVFAGQEERPRLAGHTASFVGSEMVLFGGCNATLGNKSNEVYCLGWYPKSLLLNSF